MYQRDLVRDAWKSAGLYDESDPKLQQFLALLDDPTQCWEELTQACRRNYADYKAKIVQPILDSSDTLVHLMVIRAATGDDELALLKQYISKSDPVQDETELKAIALKNDPRLNKALTKKPNLTQAVRDTIVSQATRTPRPKPQKRKTTKPRPANSSPA